ncbi:MAG: alpha/beta hydrolase [Actinomycetia bacterium]|nr:alpha/beta hydrolase [Actinomycetes bacterium]
MNPADDWRQNHNPDMSWAPRQLPGWLKAIPDWLGRSYAEARFPLEIAAWEASQLHGLGNASRGLPPGDDRPVLVVPGFGFGDPTTLPLQLALKAAGYRVVLSEIPLNIWCSNVTVHNLAKVARKAVAKDNNRRLLVVGHSRGGMIARGLAALHPDLVERAIALGSPLDHEFAFYEAPQPFVKALATLHQLHPILRERGCGTPECVCPYMLATYKPTPEDVDLVSIYTKSDGIVDWRACVVPGATNIEVSGSHLGMGLKPGTLRVVMEQLARPSA